ncbi:sugar transferase, partial [bacterium]|nr:sugar transferase [bacterium]
ATWDDPSSVMVGIDEVSEGVFAPHGAQKMENVTVVPPAWIGFQRAGFRDSVIAGPEFLGDTTPSPPRIVGLRTIREVSIPGRRRRSNLPRGTFYGAGKRSLDLVAASFAMLLLAPLYLLIAILIHRFDGRPILFRHVRQGRGGREFKCLKFRTMRNDAEEMAQNLGAIDQSDGPQVFILDDPRVTRLGRFLRMTSLDEIPQFWNVFRGHMSIVGPRPSPERENQFCPAWREARLSVRPGITGLLKESIALPLQKFATVVTSIVLETLGVDAIRRGSIIELNGQIVLVGEACNGMRLVMPIAIVMYTVVYSLPLRRAARLLLILASVPIALACNILRLIPTSLAYGFMPERAELIHDIGGWLMLPIAVLLLLGLLRFVEWLDVSVSKWRLVTA